MRLFTRKESPKAMPAHHRTALRHMQSGMAAIHAGDEALAKSHLGHALRAFSAAERNAQAVPQPTPPDGFEP